MSNNAENRFENNAVVLAGEVAGTPVYSHEVYGEGFYVFDMNIPRESGNIDTVPVMVSERMCNIEDIKVGKLLLSWALAMLPVSVSFSREIWGRLLSIIGRDYGFK